MSDCWFSSLETLKLNCFDFDNDEAVIPICPELLKSVLMAAKEMSVLDLEGNFLVAVTDAYFSEIVRANPLSSLSNLYIGAADGGEVGSTTLTVTTVQLLLSKCDCLKELDISHWNVTRQQFKELKMIVKKNNWDLVIIRREMD